MTQVASPGFAQLLGQSDAVGLFLFILLFLMSIVSWSIMGFRLVHGIAQRRRSRRFLASLGVSDTLSNYRGSRPEDPLDEPFSWLMSELSHVRGNHQVLVERSQVLLEHIAARIEQGLTVLGTIASTAPFIGLFGTVWAVYHALVAIGASGSAGLDQVAAPVGEALIMTGLGLVVAIPAVIGYNLSVRENRVLMTALSGFANRLQTGLSMHQGVPTSKE